MEKNRAIEIISQNVVPSFPAKVTLEEWYAAKDLAVEALKKQMPKAPTIESIKPYFVGYCSVCGRKLIPGRYCLDCGQAIDLDDIKRSNF